MFGKLAIIFVALAIISLIVANLSAINSSKLQSIDQSCAPLKSYDLYQDQLIIRDSHTGIEKTYKASSNGNEQFCVYDFNYHAEYGYWGWLALGFIVAVIISALVNYRYEYDNSESQKEDMKA